MKRYLLACVATLGLLGLVACAPPDTMIVKDGPASVTSIQPEPGKAALVISRTTNFGGAISFKTYLDKTYIGSTRGKCYFAKTDIAPGTKYVSSWGENGVAVKVNFEPGKVYFLQHNVSMGFLRARVAVEAVNAARLDSGDLKGCRYFVFDPSKAEPDLTETEYKDVIQGAETLVVGADGKGTLVPEKK